jgi:hypothetical protein
MHKRLLLLSSVFFLATAFTVLQQDKFKNLRENIVKNFISEEYITSYYNASRHPDTNIVFINTRDNSYTTPNKYVLVCQNGMGIPNAFKIAEIINNDYANYKDPVFNADFKKMFGLNLTAGTINFKPNEYGTDRIYKYSPIALKTAFDKLYVKPTGTLEGYTYQKLYNLSAKEYMRDMAKYFSFLFTHPRFNFKQFCAKFLKDAQTKTNFRAFAEIQKMQETIFSSDEQREKFKHFSEWISTDDLAFLVRRQCDGSLPTLLACFKTILKDYDPEALKLVKGY